MCPYKAVCFDFDYTLGDCTESIVAGFQYALPAMGWPEPDRETVRGTVGYLLEDAYTLLTGDTDPVHQAQFRPLYSSVATVGQVEKAKLFPGAEALIHGLTGAGIRTAIVSSRRSETTKQIMARFGLLEDFTVILGNRDVKKPKPDPQGLRAAMELLGVTPEETLFCGDTVLDAGAARNAGCDFAAVLLGTTPREDFSGFSPVHFANDLEDLARCSLGTAASAWHPLCAQLCPPGAGAGAGGGSALLRKEAGPVGGEGGLRQIGRAHV